MRATAEVSVPVLDRADAVVTAANVDREARFLATFARAARVERMVFRIGGVVLLTGLGVAALSLLAN